MNLYPFKPITLGCIFTMATQLSGPAIADDAVARKMSASPVQADQAPVRASGKVAVIRSREDLAQYLASTPMSESPLRYLSPHARQSFLDSLRFYDQRLASMYVEELEAELTAKQIEQILALVGYESHAAEYSVHARREMQSDVDGTGFDVSAFAPTGLGLGLITFQKNLIQFPPHTLTANEAVMERFNAAFGALLEMGRLQALDDDTLQILFEATGTVAFYSRLADPVEQMSSEFAELLARKKASVFDYRQMHGAYLGIRDFSEARRLDDAYDGDLAQPTPTVSYSPDMHEHAPKWMSLQGQHLNVEEVSPQEGKKVIVVALCHFAVPAKIAIENDPQLKSLFRGSLWVAPQAGNLLLDEIQAWNDGADVTRLHLMYDQWDWPPLPDGYGTSPVFYFLDQGKLVAEVVGWPEDSRKQDLFAAFGKLGQWPVAKPK